MTQREARWVAMLMIADEIDRMYEVSDEWLRHPETNERLHPDDVFKVKEQARRYAKKLAKAASAKLAEKRVSRSGERTSTARAGAENALRAALKAGV